MNTIKNSFVLLLLNLIIFILFFYSCSYTQRKCKKLLKASITKSYDMVVVPGCPFDNKQWSTAMKARVYWSKYLYDKGIAKNIMYSGNAVYTPYYESRIMALYAEAIGIPMDHIFTETKAEHSTENIYYSYKKSKKTGFVTIALASDPFQTKLLQRFTRIILDNDVAMIPFVYDTLRAMQPRMTDPAIDYQQAFVKDFIPLPERENFFERLRGTSGQDIDTSAYK